MVDLAGAPELEARVPFPEGFVPYAVSTPGTGRVAYVGGALDGRAAIIPLHVSEGQLDPAILLPEGAFAGSVVSFGDLLVVETGAALHALRLETGGYSAVEQVALSAPVTAITRVGEDQLWVALENLARVLVFEIGGDPVFGAESSVETPEPVIRLRSDRNGDDWVYALGNASLSRLLVATRAVEWTHAQGGGSRDPVGASLDVTFDRLFVSLPGVTGLAWYGRGGLDHAVEVESDVPLEIGSAVRTVTGFVASEDEGTRRSGHEDDLAEDLFRFESGPESLLLLRPTHWFVPTVLTRYEGDTPADVAAHLGGLQQVFNDPVALRLPGGTAQVVGLSVLDWVNGSTAFRLDRVPLAEDRAEMEEVEPNDALEGAPLLTSETVLKGRVAPGDPATLSVPLLQGEQRDRLEDVYQVANRPLVVVLELEDPQADVDLYLVDEEGSVISRSTVTDLGATESLLLSPWGPRYLGVSAFDGSADAPETEYTLYLAPL